MYKDLYRKIRRPRGKGGDLVFPQPVLVTEVPKKIQTLRWPDSNLKSHWNTIWRLQKSMLVPLKVSSCSHLFTRNTSFRLMSLWSIICGLTHVHVVVFWVRTHSSHTTTNLPHVDPYDSFHTRHPSCSVRGPLRTVTRVVRTYDAKLSRVIESSALKFFFLWISI